MIELYRLDQKTKIDEFGFGRGENAMLSWVGWALSNGSAGDGSSPFLIKGDLGTPSRHSSNT